MHRGTFFTVLTGIVSFIVIIKLLTLFIFEPLIRVKTEAVLTEKIKDYNFHIEKVHVKLLSSAIQADGITFVSEKMNGSASDLTGEISYIKIKGINILKALFAKDIKIRELIISAPGIRGAVRFPEKSKRQVILPLNLQIGEIIIDKVNLSVRNALNSQKYQVKDGTLKVYDLHLIKRDTLSKEIIRQFDFETPELIYVSADSLNTYSIKDALFSSVSNTLSAVSFTIHPNYPDYEFTSRFKYQKNRIEAVLTNIHLKNFNAADYFRSGNFISSSIGIGNLEMNVFRDKRKEFRHINRIAFQDIIYNYQGLLRIDTISILNGSINFREHAEKANEPGYIAFSNIDATLLNISNDSVFRKEKAYLELKCNALFMGNGKLNILFMSRIFDSQNTFSVSGRLSEMEIPKMNPYLEKNAFIYASSGKIDEMNFSFTANNTKATGKMTLLYTGLDIAVKNKNTDDTTAFKERLISLIANRKIINSNPVNGEGVRTGIIEYKRDPEKFLFSYFARSILSGIKSSILDNPKQRKNK